MLQVVFSCTGCSSKCAVLTSGDGSISEGPSAYSKNCSWIIAPSYKFIQVAIHFTEFHSGNEFDSVSVYECTDIFCEEQKLLRELSGFVPMPDVIISTTGVMLVQFISGSANTSSGFNARWEVYQVSLYFLLLLESTTIINKHTFIQVMTD
jgi:hypothetical protein